MVFLEVIAALVCLSVLILLLMDSWFTKKKHQKLSLDPLQILTSYIREGNWRCFKASVCLFVDSFPDSMNWERVVEECLKHDSKCLEVLATHRPRVFHSIYDKCFLYLVESHRYKYEDRTKDILILMNIKDLACESNFESLYPRLLKICTVYGQIDLIQTIIKDKRVDLTQYPKLTKKLISIGLECGSSGLGDSTDSTSENCCEPLIL